VYVLVFPLTQRSFAVMSVKGLLTFPNQTEYILGRPTHTHTHTHSRASDGGGSENTTKNKTNTESSRGLVAGQVFPIHTHIYPW